MKYCKEISSSVKAILIALPFFSCSLQKEVKILGFAYKRDSIIITKDGKSLLNISVDGNEDKNKICSLYEKVKLTSKKKDIKLNIVIDSNNVKVLDTLVIIPNNCKEPFISFIYPSVETKYKRNFFIADANDSNYIKY